MVVLAVGDVVGEPGLVFCEKRLSSLRRLYGIDLIVVNGENADTPGIRPAQAVRLLDAGADVITLGNHAWHRRELLPFIEDTPRLVRPANFPSPCPGNGYFIFHANDGRRVCVLNLIGRLHMDFRHDDPFRLADKVLSSVDADVFLVDFHAEATSEKAALAWHLDGRAAAVWGTHTHVPTADEQILPQGTGFISDLGMTGPTLSVLGMRPAQSVGFFLGGPPQRFAPPDSPVRLDAVLLELNGNTCRKIERLSVGE